MKNNPFSIFAALIAASSLISTAAAATFYWDDGTVVVDAASGGGTGTWTIGAPGWEDGASAQNWADANDAVLGGTAGILTLGGPISATGVSVNTSGYNLTLVSNALTTGALNYGGAAAGSLTITGNSGTTNAANVVTLNGPGTGWSGISVNLNGGGNPAAGTATQNGPLAKLVFGNASALGASTASSAALNVVHGMIQAGGAGMTVVDNINIGAGSLYFGGENNFEVTGLVKQNFNASRTIGVWEGSAGSRTITLNNLDTNGTGSFNFEARGATPATPNPGGGFIVNGAITGIGGLSTVTALAFPGNTVTLTGTNTYTGKTAQFSGTIIVSATGSITATSGVQVENAGAVAAVVTNAGTVTSTGTAATSNSGGTVSLALRGNGVTGGTFNNSGTASFATAGLNGNLNLTGGSMTVTGQFNVGEAAGNYGVINQSLGTMNLSTADPNGIRIAHWTTSANTSEYNLSGGTLNVLNTTFNNGWDGKALLSISGTGIANLKGLANGAAAHGGTAGTGVTLTAGRLNIGTSGITQNGVAKFFNLGVATVGAFADWTGSAAMALTDAGTGTTFNTLDSVDLTTARTITISGVLSGAGKLVKTGPGTLVLSGANTYTGDTTVANGVLAVSGTSIADTNKLVISGGKVNPSGSTETVNTLFLGAAQQVTGTYGSLASAATFKSDTYFVTGSTGVIDVVTVPSTNNYASWIDGYNVGGLTGPKDDFDKDGLANAVENLLGSDPSVSNTGLTQVSATGNSFKFQHSQSNTIATDVTKSYQFSTDLVEWKSSGQTTSGGTTATITAATLVDNAAPTNDVIEVTVTVTSGPAVKVFARLVATQG